MKKLVAIRHVAFEGLDAFEPAFRNMGYAIHYIDICNGGYSIHQTKDADILVILGGPIGANEDTQYPFLKTELKMIEQHLKLNKPVMGICLGAQLIARTYGARIYNLNTKEIGCFPIELTSAGAHSCLSGFKPDPTAWHWHGDTFDLPRTAINLAKTTHTEHQAFRLGANVIGFQFHPEMSGINIEHWLVGHAAEISAANLIPSTLRRQATLQAKSAHKKAQNLIRCWLEGMNDN